MMAHNTFPTPVTSESELMFISNSQSVTCNMTPGGWSPWNCIPLLGRFIKSRSGTKIFRGQEGGLVPSCLWLVKKCPPPSIIQIQIFSADLATFGNFGRFAGTGAFNIYSHYGRSAATGAFGIFYIYSHFGRSVGIGVFGTFDIYDHFGRSAGTRAFGIFFIYIRFGTSASSEAISAEVRFAGNAEKYRKCRISTFSYFGTICQQCQNYRDMIFQYFQQFWPFWQILTKMQACAK